MTDPTSTKQPLKTWATLFALAAIAASLSTSTRPAPPKSNNHDEATLPALSPQDSLTKLKLAGGLKIELAASEPMIAAPVAATFDEDGRLWVVEMQTYMNDAAATGEKEPRNRIVILEDTDGDGLFTGPSDKATVFLDNLVLPRAVAPCYGGALVIEPPNLYFCRDTDGDGKADEKRQLLTGLGGKDNPEHAANGLLYGLDNWYHLSQHDTEFRFDGKTLETRPTPVVGQWGITQDDVGRLYYTPNSNPLLCDLFPKHYAARNPHLRSVAGIGESVMKDASVWPAHETPAVNRAYQTGTLGKDKKLATMTAACGPLIYRASALGDEYRNNVFICEAAGNLVKRATFDDESKTNGIPSARNAYSNAEFLTSTDTRFRPVNLCTAPDGSLYVIDMSRGVIQHKTYMSPYLKDITTKQGLETPVNMGRIWRISNPNSARSAPPKLSHATNPELVTLLKHPDGWWRDSAQRLLVERNATEAAAALQQLVASSESATVRLKALWTLRGIGELTNGDIIKATTDPDPLIRTAGVRLGESRISDPAVSPALAKIADADSDRWVRVQAALMLPVLPRSVHLALAKSLLLKHADDKVLRATVLSGLSGFEQNMLGRLMEEKSWPRNDNEKTLLAELSDAALRSDASDRTDFVEFAGQLATDSDPRTSLLLSRVRAAQRLDKDNPVPIKLAAAPDTWLAAAKSDSPLADSLTGSAMYFDWPGRPPVDRPRRVGPLSAEDQSRYNRGKDLFTACAACHQPEGKGAPGLAPSLIGSSIVLGPEDTLAKILLRGLEGEYEFDGEMYGGVMPAAVFPDDGEYAAVMTYIRRAFGNSADPVHPETVERVRAATAGQTVPYLRKDIDAGK